MTALIRLSLKDAQEIFSLILIFFQFSAELNSIPKSDIFTVLNITENILLKIKNWWVFIFWTLQLNVLVQMNKRTVVTWFAWLVDFFQITRSVLLKRTTFLSTFNFYLFTHGNNHSRRAVFFNDTNHFSFKRSAKHRVAERLDVSDALHSLIFHEN